MYSYISVPPSNAPSNAATPAVQTHSDPEQAMAVIEQLDLLRPTQDLVDKICEGKVAAKDAHNEAGPIRAKISRVKQAIAQLEEMDEDLPTRLAKIEELEYKVSRKRDLLKQFQASIGADVEMG